MLTKFWEKKKCCYSQFKPDRLGAFTLTQHIMHNDLSMTIKTIKMYS